VRKFDIGSRLCTLELSRRADLKRILRVSVHVGRHSETSLELTVEVFLAPVSEVQRYGFNLHSRSDLSGADSAVGFP